MDTKGESSDKSYFGAELHFEFPVWRLFFYYFRRTKTLVLQLKADVNDDHLGAVSGRASKRRRSCYGLPCATDLLVAVNNPFLSQIHHKTTTQLLAAAHDYTSQSLVTFWDRTKVLTNKSLGKKPSSLKEANFGKSQLLKEQILVHFRWFLTLWTPKVVACATWRSSTKVTRKMGKRLKALRHATLQVLNSLSHGMGWGWRAVEKYNFHSRYACLFDVVCCWWVVSHPSIRRDMKDANPSFLLA